MAAGFPAGSGPLSPGEIVVGKTVPAFLIGIGEGTLMVTVAVFYFHIPLTGSVALLYGAMSAFLLLIDFETGTASDAARKVLESAQGAQMKKLGLVEGGKFLANELARRGLRRVE